LTLARSLPLANDQTKRMPGSRAVRRRDPLFRRNNAGVLWTNDCYNFLAVRAAWMFAVPFDEIIKKLGTFMP